METAISIIELVLGVFCAVAIGIYLAFKDEIACGLSKLFAQKEGDEG